jgi:hypothetical protein
MLLSFDEVGTPKADARGTSRMKAPREKVKAKRRKVPTAARQLGVLTAYLQTQLDQRTRERDEARKQLAEVVEQQVATSDVLRVI